MQTHPSGGEGGGALQYRHLCMYAYYLYSKIVANQGTVFTTMVDVSRQHGTLALLLVATAMADTMAWAVALATACATTLLDTAPLPEEPAVMSHTRCETIMRITECWKDHSQAWFVTTSLSAGDIRCSVPQKESETETNSSPVELCLTLLHEYGYQMHHTTKVRIEAPVLTYLEFGLGCWHWKGRW